MATIWECDSCCAGPCLFIYGGNEVPSTFPNTPQCPHGNVDNVCWNRRVQDTVVNIKKKRIGMVWDKKESKL